MTKADRTREKILTIGAELFAEQGIKATTVRMICTEAGVTHNMVGHYFGGKDGLINELISRYANGLFTGALRIIEDPVQNAIDFETRYRLFQKESLASAIDNRNVIILFINYSEKEKCPAYPEAVEAAQKYQKGLHGFLKAGVQIGAVREDADVGLLAAALWDRIIVQVRYVKWLSSTYGDENVLNPDFRTRWLNANVDAFLYGVTPRK